MEVNVQKRRLARGRGDEVRIPDFLEECFWR
jgi:hypothetical protein